jgi:FKBP-type peptidyl-prolyl cis-trans isomerase FkpA
LAALAVSACGGAVTDANSTATPSAPVAQASPTARQCAGLDATVPKGSPDDFNAGKDTAPTTLPDGLKYVDLTTGGGAPVQAGQCLTIHYSLFLADGTAVESSRNATGQGAFKFQQGGGSVIKGFDEGVQGMKVGGRRRVTVPPELGYGVKGQPPKIPANSTLVFVIEVVSAA